ncbi:DUF3949 domain-containing protein [Halobacillus mangrovi]|uniref:DUF3949 domain-containing protein n=1 Tax=Halobacillus mangrovi TaxID=402384 RepID=UPI003D966D81
MFSFTIAPFQPLYLKKVKKKENTYNQPEQDYYDSMKIQEEVLHDKSQGNLIFLLAVLFFKLQKKI